MAELTPNPAGLAHRDWDEAQADREFSLPLELGFLLRAPALEHQFLEMGAEKRETKQAGQWGALELHSGSWQGHSNQPSGAICYKLGSGGGKAIC